MPRVLPTEFELAHDLSFVLHHFLAEHVVQGERANLLSFEAPLNKKEDATGMNGLEGKALWRSLEANGYRHLMDNYAYRSLIFALVADMCHFVYEGLNCSAKGKLSVAFAILRKPLQDNLFYLEWILADWPDFLDRFQKGQLDLSKSDQKKSKRVDVIGRAMDKLPLGRWIDPELLYELRYEKASQVGLDPIFNQAIHLVTTAKGNETSPENLNFIFCDDDNRVELWRSLYSLLPPVLMHALFIVRASFEAFAPDFEPRDAPDDLWLSAGLLLWAQTLRGDKCRFAATTIFNETMADLALDCPQCDRPLILEADELRSFWDDGVIRCGKCNGLQRLLNPRHVFDREHNNRGSLFERMWIKLRTAFRH